MPRRARIASISGTTLVLGAAAVAIPLTLNAATAEPTTSGPLAAYEAANREPLKVPAGPVEAHVDEVALTTSTGRATEHATKVDKPRTDVIKSDPQDVTGFGVVGVTWSGDLTGDVRPEVRTSTDGVWSAWTPMSLDVEDHGPDAGSAEARSARQGTDEFLAGHVDQVQTRIIVPDAAEVPADLELAVIEPGKPGETVDELPEIHTDKNKPTAASAHSGNKDSDLNLVASAYTASPTIYSRSQWGADETIREQSAPAYRQIHGGFVHHEAGSNDYTEADVPGIIRGIYEYHVKTRGYRDVGYNFFIDKFGRIWEGRYGGVDLPVEGAHTSGYNYDSFGTAALGCFDTVAAGCPDSTEASTSQSTPTDAMIQAYGSLYAWKLSLHGVTADATNVTLTKTDGTKTVFPHAIQGHRDANTTATICPGENLEAALPRIRTLAAGLQKSWSGRDLESNIAGTSHSDFVARRVSDGRIFTLRTGGFAGFSSTRTSTTVGSTVREAVVTPDITGDGKADLIQVRDDGSAGIRKGRGDGTFAAVFKNLGRSTFSGVSKITATGNIGGTSANDLVGKNSKGYLVRYTGNGAGGFTRAGTTRSLSGFDKLAATGDVNKDGKRDLIGRKSGALYYFKGSGSGTFGSPTKLATQSPSWSSLVQISGYGDFTGDGRGDLIGRDSSNRGWIYPASGTGFGKPLGPYADVNRTLVGAVNLLGNSLPDLVMKSGSTLYVKPNSGRVSLAAPVDSGITLTSATALMNAGDWNRDGKGDFLAKMSDGSVRLYRGYGTGKFAGPVTIATGLSTVSVIDAVGDITGDGFPDLMGRTSDGTIKLWPGKGSTKVGASIVMRSSAAGTRLVGVGRWNGGNTPDVLFVNGTSTVVHESNGPGGLVSTQTLSVNLSGYDAVLGVRDLRAGSGGDLIMRSGSYIYALERNSTGTGVTRTYLGALSGYNLLG
ncbi:FG-GAP-like repeat-containing protein [Nocardioides sp. NPDC126508]